MEKNKFKIVVLFFSLLVLIKVNAQDNHGLVKWLTFKEAFEQNKKQPKPFLIDVYTDWCGWCKHMIKTTYSNPGLAQYINNWFYSVQFNAETKDSIEYQGKWYYNKGTTARATHELAIKLLDNKLMYPTTLFANPNANFMLNTQGFLDEKKIEPLLVYTVENIYHTTPYEDFAKYYEKSVSDTVKPKVEVKWLTFKEALKQQKIKPKKILVNIYTSWCNGCRVMNKTTFTSALNAAYINENFYPVDFNAEIKDTINFNGTNYMNNGANGIPFHQLAMALVNNNLALPSLIVMDEKLQKVDHITQYITPEALEPALRFYGSNAYQKQKWEEFRKFYTPDKKAK